MWYFIVVPTLKFSGSTCGMELSSSDVYRKKGQSNSDKGKGLGLVPKEDVHIYMGT